MISVLALVIALIALVTAATLGAAAARRERALHAQGQRLDRLEHGAELIARTYLCSIVSGVDPRTFWYNFRNDGDDPFYFEHALGTIRSDGRPKPAYLAYATLAAVLEGMKYDGAVESGQGIFAHRFISTHGDGRTVFAAWSPASDSTADLRLPAKRARVMNAIGEATDDEAQPIPGDPAHRILRLRLKATLA